MYFQIDLLADLKKKFVFLTFMTDLEIERFFGVVGSVAEGTSMSPDKILEMIDEQSCKNLAYC